MAWCFQGEDCSTGENSTKERDGRVCLETPYGGTRLPEQTAAPPAGMETRKGMEGREGRKLTAERGCKMSSQWPVFVPIHI